MAPRVLWTPERIAALREMVGRGVRPQTIADELGTTLAAIHQKTWREHLGRPRLDGTPRVKRTKRRRVSHRADVSVWDEGVTRNPIRLDLAPPPTLTAALMGDPRPGRTPWA